MTSQSRFSPLYSSQSLPIPSSLDKLLLSFPSKEKEKSRSPMDIHQTQPNKMW